MPGILEKSRGISSCHNYPTVYMMRTLKLGFQQMKNHSVEMLLWHSIMQLNQNARAAFHYFSAVLMHLVFLGILVMQIGYNVKLFSNPSF